MKVGETGGDRGRQSHEDERPRRLGRRRLRADDEPRERRPGLGAPRGYREPDGPRRRHQRGQRERIRWSSPGTLGTGIFKVFDLGVGKTGLSEEGASDAGFEVVSAGLSAYDRAGLLSWRGEGLPQAHRRPDDGAPARRGGRGHRRRQAYRHLRHGPLGQAILPRPRQHRPRLLPAVRPRPQPGHPGRHHPFWRVRPRQRRRQGLRVARWLRQLVSTLRLRLRFTARFTVGDP